MCWRAWVAEIHSRGDLRQQRESFFKITAEGAGERLERFAVDSARRLCIVDALRGFADPSGVEVAVELENAATDSKGWKIELEMSPTDTLNR